MSAKRWSSYDTDTYRLPNGLTRVGYDSDSQKYTFRDSSGQEYTSASGSAYGPLEKVPAGWDGGPLCSPRSARTGSASSASSAGVKGPATDFSEILGDMDEEHVDEKDKPKEKGPPMAFSVLGQVMSFKTRLKSRRARREEAEVWTKLMDKEYD